MTSPYHQASASQPDLSPLAPRTNPVFDGTVTLPPGDATVPGVSFAADADTGLGRPQADTLALFTAGAQRVRVSSSGGVMVGPDTRLPAARLSFGAVVATDLLHLFDNGSYCYGFGIGGLPALQIYALTGIGAVSVGGRNSQTGASRAKACGSYR